jgi:hypothetical protein
MGWWILQDELRFRHSRGGDRILKGCWNFPQVSPPVPVPVSDKVSGDFLMGDRFFIF